MRMGWTTGPWAGRTCRLALATLLIGALAPVSPGSAQTNVITNGEFSQGLTGWTTQVLAQGPYAGYPHFRVLTEAKCEPAQQGNPFLEIDVPGGARGYVQQQIAVPAAPGPLTFRTWGNLETVQVTISAVTSNGAAHPLLAYSPPTLQGSVGGCSGLKPIPESLNVAMYAGQTIGLRLEATSAGHDGTIADFDDFSLIGTSHAPALKCIVPKLKGLTLSAAKQKLKKAGCSVGKVKQGKSSSVHKGRVISSSPGKGSRRSAGTKVAVVISSG
jgi:PASTA domain